MKSYDELVAAAAAAREMAYAPYSGYRVGAALRTAEGRTFCGANCENVSYGLSVCAERNAVLAAVMAGAREFEAIAIVAESSPPAPPCGMCLQTLAEFAAQLEIVLAPVHGGAQVLSLAELLPRPFGPSFLTSK